MMNPATAPSYMQGYPGNPSMQMQAMGQPNMMDSSVAMSQGGNPGGVVVTSFNGGSSTSNPSHMSVQQTPNATVIPTGMSNGHMMTSGPPGSLPMHMTRQVPPNGAMYPAGHPANMAMMKGHAVNPNAKYAAGPMMPAGMNGNPHNAAMMMGNGPMSAQQIAMYSNNNTVPYSPHGMYQQQFPMGAMGGASQQRGMPKQMMGNQMMMSQEMAAAAAAQQNRVMNSMNGGPPNGMNRVGGQPQNGMNPNMYPPGQVHMNPQQQQQSMQTQHMFQGMVPNSSHSMSTQQQQSLSMQQSASMAAAAAAQNGVSTANMNANMLNRQQQQQKLIALQQQQQHFQQQQQQQRVSQQMAMRQAITPPANLGSDTSQGMMMNPNYPQGPMPMGPNGRLTMKDQQNSSMGGPNSINGPMPSPASAQQQMTASMTMIGAPHSVPASHEVMPVSPQVQPNQLGMHGQNMGSMNPLMTSASKRQTATPPSASPISNQHPMNNPAQHPNNNSSSSRATPSPIHQRKHSSSASLKRRSSSTSSFNNDCNNPNDPNKPSSNNATDDISGEPSKICRLSSSTNIDATNPMSFNYTTNNATSIRNPMSTGGPSSTSYSTLTLSQLNDNSRKDSTCSSSNTDTHSSPDSGMGDSVGESSNVCGMNNTSNNNNNNNSQNPLSRLMPSNNNNNNNSIRTSTEEMLENLIQELGIEKLDHLPELVDIFSDCNDSVFSSNTTSSNTTNPNQTTASHGYSTTNNSASSTSATDTKMKQSLLSCSAQRTTNPIGQKC